MIRVRMIIAYDLEPACSRVLLHTNLVRGVDQETVALRFDRRGIDR
jgi:hypothetical protein